MRRFLVAVVCWAVLLRVCPAYSVTGDLNCDNTVGFGDINPFVLALANPASYEASYPGCILSNGDLNGDGQVDFRDINPLVAKIAQCAANQPPVADAGGDLEGSVGIPLTFDGGGSIASNGLPLSYEWNFGDGSPSSEGVIVSHSYTASGSYPVSLEVADSCGATDLDSVTVVVLDGSDAPQGCCLPQGTCGLLTMQECTAAQGLPLGPTACNAVACPVAGGELTAGFKVYHNQPGDIDVTGFEYGLSLTFDASDLTQGASYYFFEFGDGTGNGTTTQPVAHHGYSAPGSYTVTLTVCDENLTSCALSVPLTVTSNNPSLSKIDLSGIGNASSDFVPAGSARTSMVFGERLWVAGGNGEIGYVPLTSATFDAGLHVGIWDAISISSMCSFIAGQGEYLALARVTFGLDIWRVDQDTPVLVRHLPGAFGNFHSVAAHAGKLYIGTGQGRVLEYGTATLVDENIPSVTYEREFQVTHSASELIFVQDDLFVGGLSTTLTVLHLGADPVSAETIALPGSATLVHELDYDEGILVVRHGGLVSVIDVAGKIVLSSFASLADAIGIYKSRMYLLFNGSVRELEKFDLSNPAYPYQMEGLAIFPPGGFGDIVVKDIGGQSVMFFTGTGGVASFAIEPYP